MNILRKLKNMFGKFNEPVVTSKTPRLTIPSHITGLVDINYFLTSLENYNITVKRLRVLNYLLSTVNSKNIISIPSLVGVADVLEIPESTLRSAINSLVKCNLLCKKQTNVYMVNPYIYLSNLVKDADTTKQNWNDFKL